MTDTEKTETKRDRVRRLVITPLQDAGMRFPKAVPDDKRTATLNRICDELAYASDPTLQAVASWARLHGDGSDRSFFPPVVGFLSTAESYEPQPLEYAPAVASWFKSRAGEEAKAAGRLLAEFRFIEAKKRPPINDRERKAIADRAYEYRRQVELACDRINRGVEPGPSDREFLAWYQAVEARAVALVEEGRAARKAQGAAA